MFPLFLSGFLIFRKSIYVVGQSLGVHFIYFKLEYIEMMFVIEVVLSQYTCMYSDHYC